MAAPEIIAHRGAHREYTENTLEAFELALAEGADAIELDVHATADGQIVVHHDPALPEGSWRGAPGRPLIRETAGAEICQVVLPGGERVPFLKEVLDAIGDRARIYIEAKAPGMEVELVRLLNVEKYDVAVHSFDHRIARAVHSSGSRLPVGLLTVSYLLEAGAVLNAAGARDWWQQHELVDAELVSSIHAAGGRVIPWTVNDPSDIARMIALGVDGICTDHPAEIVALVR